MLPDAVSSVLRRKSGDRKVLSIGPDASVYEAIAMMAENSIGALLVVSNGSSSASCQSATTRERSCCSRDRRRTRA